MKFFVGIHQPVDCCFFKRCMVSVNRLRNRKRDFYPREWLMDSGAFTEITKHGGYREPPEEYAAQIKRWSRCGNLLAAVTQDWMCEPFATERTGLSLQDHQRLTVERFDALIDAMTQMNVRVYLLPVLQGISATDYVRHIEQYGQRLRTGDWCGVGSVCKRNKHPAAIEGILQAIHEARPDLRLHGFGLKITALKSGVCRKLLSSADSMAWSILARRAGRSPNCRKEAAAYVKRVEGQQWQDTMF